MREDGTEQREGERERREMGIEVLIDGHRGCLGGLAAFQPPDR